MFEWKPRIYFTSDDGTGGGTGSSDAEKKKKTSIDDTTAAIIRRSEAKKADLLIEKELAEAAGLKYDAELKQLEIERQEIAQQQEYLKFADLSVKAIEAKVEALKKEKDELLKGPTTEEQAKQAEALTKAIDGITKAQEKGKKQLTAEIAARKEANAAMKENVEFSKEASESTGKFIAEKLKLNKVMKLAANPMAAANLLLTQVVSQTWAATMAYDSARSELMKLTGGTTQYNAALADTIQAGAAAGLTRTEAAAGFTALAGSMYDFGQQSKAVQIELGTTAGVFKGFGVDISENMNVATKGMGFTSEAANQLQVDLFATGAALGPHMTKKVMAGFGPAMASLAAFTKDRAIKVFKQLAAQAAATGLAISDLTGLAEKFDTYDGAAESVGRLNSLLGGDYLNSVQMLNASEGDRIKMLQDSLKMSGRQFSDMNRFEKKALASSVGIKDMTKAMKLFGTSSENMEIMRKKAEDAGMSLDQFKARQKASNSVQKQFQIIMQSLGVVIAPVVDALSAILGFVSKHITVFRIIVGLIGLWVLGKKAWVKWTMLQAAWNATWTFSIGAETTAKGINTGVTEGETLAKKKSLVVTSASVLPTLALGAAILMIGVAVAIAAVGMAQFVMAFKGFSAGQILAISVALLVFMGAMTGMVALLIWGAPFMAGATITLLAFGGAMIMIGAGIALAAVGFKLLGSATAYAAIGVTSLGKAMASFIKNTGIGVIGSAAMAIVKFAGAIGILTLSLAALQVLSIVTAVTSFFGLGPANVLAGFIHSVASAVASIEGDTISKLVGMSTSVKDLASSLASIGNVDSKVVTNTIDVFEQISKIKPGSGEAAGKAIEALQSAVMSVKSENKIQLELTINHNNVKATEDAFAEFTKNFNKALNKGRA